MKKILLILFVLFSLPSFATFEKEFFVWSPLKDWGVIDDITKDFYPYLPITEQALDVLQNMDRRYVHQCEIKSRDIRHLFANHQVVIGLYNIQNCVRVRRNDMW